VSEKQQLLGVEYRQSDVECQLFSEVLQNERRTTHIALFLRWDSIVNDIRQGVMLVRREVLSQSRNTAHGRGVTAPSGVNAPNDVKHGKAGTEAS
jgi:hypothetical protein